MNSIAIDNKIETYLGFKVGINVHNKNGKKFSSKIINGVTLNEFFCLFNEDVDFVLEFDNRYCFRGIRVILTINGQNYYFYISPGKLSILETLENNGRKLHFKSQESDDGQLLVAATANKYGKSYKEASIECSTISFSIEVEKNIEKVSWKCGLHLGRKIKVTIETLFGQKTDMVIGNEEFVLDLKRKFAKLEGISDEMNLIYDMQMLENYDRLKKCGIDDGSVILATNYVYPAERSYLLKRSFRGTLIDQGHTVTDGIQTMGLSKPKNCLSPPQSIDTSSLLSTKSEESNPRGVICYGEKSKQRFETYFGFIKDNDLIIKNFVIEFRINSKYKPV